MPNVKILSEQVALFDGGQNIGNCLDAGRSCNKQLIFRIDHIDYMGLFNNPT
jgi:hypothetical protein